MTAGPVFLVGAGPGDPELLTLRAAGLLARADAVFHDELVSDAVLARCRQGAELVPVGHRAGVARVPVGDIVARMAERANRAEVVVRLKGGDPFVFGRGGEEALALLAQDVAFEVVPGVSSALAAPAAAGIPVTHRGISSSVCIVTGNGSGRVRWRALAGGADTLVVLMGASRMGQLCSDIIAAGRSAATPAAVIAAASLPQQRHVAATLGSIAEVSAREGIPTPAVLVVGEVAALSGVLASGLPEALAAAV